MPVPIWVSRMKLEICQCVLGWVTVSECKCGQHDDFHITLMISDVR